VYRKGDEEFFLLIESEEILVGDKVAVSGLACGEAGEV
jgi:hypothetical protein